MMPGFGASENALPADAREQSTRAARWIKSPYQVEAPRIAAMQELHYTEKMFWTATVVKSVANAWLSTRILLRSQMS